MVCDSCPGRKSTHRLKARSTFLNTLRPDYVLEGYRLPYVLTKLVQVTFTAFAVMVGLHVPSLPFALRWMLFSGIRCIVEVEVGETDMRVC